MTGVKGKSGGFRDGAGRKPKYNEETVVIRVPKSLVPKIKRMMSQLTKKNKSK